MAKRSRKTDTTRLANDAETKATIKPELVNGNNSYVRGLPLKLLTSILLSLMVASLVHRNDLWPQKEVKMRRPDVLLNYSQFRALYPRLKEPTAVETSRRHLLFIYDLMGVGAQTISYLAGSKARLARQTPFKSDRTIMEQHDILGQLEEFNMTQIMLNFKIEQEGETIDRPVSLGTGEIKMGATLKTGSKVSKWFRRTIQGDSYYEIPNYPLDAQPDDAGPDRITHIDADLRNCSGSIHNQGHCGACYAFSWNSLAEWHYCRQAGGNQIDFSEQHLLDCGHLAGLTGCREGYLKDAMRFSDKFGFHLEEEYPYRGKQASGCTKRDGKVKLKVVDFTRIQVNREQWERVLLEQPILLQVHLPRDVMSYHKGVHHGLNCDESMAHGMLLVGHGREAGIPYWILRNSMGSHWGENGYLRLSRDAPMSKCFRTGFIAKFKFESLDEEAYYDLYDEIKFKPSVHVMDEVRPGAIRREALNWFNGIKNET